MALDSSSSKRYREHLAAHVDVLIRRVALEIKPDYAEMGCIAPVRRLLRAMSATKAFGTLPDRKMIVLAAVLDLAFELNTYKAGKYRDNLLRCIAEMVRYSEGIAEIDGVEILQALTPDELEKLVEVAHYIFSPIEHSTSPPQ